MEMPDVLYFVNNENKYIQLNEKSDSSATRETKYVKDEFGDVYISSTQYKEMTDGKESEKVETVYFFLHSEEIYNLNLGEDDVCQGIYSVEVIE